MSSDPYHHPDYQDWREEEALSRFGIDCQICGAQFLPKNDEDITCYCDCADSLYTEERSF